MGGRPLRALGSAGLGLRAPLGLELGAVGTTGWAPLSVGGQGSGQLHRWAMSGTPAGAPELPRLMGFFSEGGTPQPRPSSAPARLGRSPGACWARRCPEPKARDLGSGVWGGPGVWLPLQRLAGPGSGQQEPLWRSQGGQGCQGPWWGSIPPRLVFVNLSFN